MTLFTFALLCKNKIKMFGFDRFLCSNLVCRVKVFHSKYFRVCLNWYFISYVFNNNDLVSYLIKIFNFSVFFWISDGYIYFFCLRLGILTNTDKCCPEKLILRMAYAEVFPDIEAVLAGGSSNLSYLQFSDLIYSNAVENNLVSLVICFDQSKFSCYKEW